MKIPPLIKHLKKFCWCLKGGFLSCGEAARKAGRLLSVLTLATDQSIRSAGSFLKRPISIDTLNGHEIFAQLYSCHTNNLVQYLSTLKDEINIFEFTETFPNEAACIAFLEESRWQNSIPISPFGGGEAYRIGTRPGVYKCKSTGRHFSVRNGTIFEESRLPLKKWFFAIFLLNSLKKGISSIQLAKYLGVTQTTGWFMLQRIRYAVEHNAFTAPFSGERRGGVRGHARQGKTPFVGILKREDKIHCKAVPNVKTGTLSPNVRSDFQWFQNCFGQFTYSELIA